ncbi:hypothetical protein BGZ49_005793 [Haplosporangium sp. Z 27]|nr:hypothetical protein BGZ49_005793 [Haplosporangium sp. Z 27]
MPNFELRLISGPRNEYVLYIVRTVLMFLRSFKSYFEVSLPGVFDEMCCQYMRKLLSLPRYQQMIDAEVKKPRYNSATWESSQLCVRSMFRLKYLQAEITNMLFKIKLKFKESIYQHIQRIRDLIDCSNVDPYSQDLFREFADQGRIRIAELQHYSKIFDIFQMLSFLENCPDALTGPKGDDID